MHPKRNLRVAVALAALLAGASAFYLPATLAATTPPCQNHLAGSSFEIDPSANLKVDDTTDECIDWLSLVDATGKLPATVVKADVQSGTGDDSFGKGTSENDANPQIVSGSIPPNKSDLTDFGINTEAGSGGKFLELFWSRVQNPSGTTNMDFELNQNFCDPTANPTNCANNGTNPAKTPVRLPGDKLITYDLSKGGTVPTISIRTWQASGSWGAATVISGTGTNTAIGAVNTSPIAAADSGGLGSLDPFTFGEAAINFSAIFSGNTCNSFGSAYLKSRSSDSFTSEIKDFIAPEPVTISNCTSIVTKATSATIGSAITDTATLSGATDNATGTITFKVYNSTACTNPVDTETATVNGNGDYTASFTPTALGTYYWSASYDGDGNNSPSSEDCDATNTVETSTVTKLASSISTAQSVFPQDSATITPGSAGGTVTFKLYGPDNPTCSTATGDPVFSQDVTVASGTATTSNTTYSISTASASAYHWVAVYGGDSTHDGSTSACTESFTLTINNG